MSELADFIDSSVQICRCNYHCAERHCKVTQEIAIGGAR
jgi:hypothetical protein